jgi:hypothetical protein
MHLKANTLFYGDDLDILREYTLGQFAGMPSLSITFKQAGKVKPDSAEQPGVL